MLKKVIERNWRIARRNKVNDSFILCPIISKVLLSETLNGLLETERKKILRNESQISDGQSKQKMIDQLMERVATIEKEKSELVSQYDKYATISDEVGIYKKRVSDMSQVLADTEKSLDKERSDKASIEHSQEDLLKKMKELQKENDQLVVKLEGLKTENEGLLNKNKKLEDRIKVLEDQNKQQLQQINDALKMPTPLTHDRDSLNTKSAKEAQKILKTVESSQKTASIERRNSSSPTLTIPTVISDEKRPASAEKDLKVIPKIVEPSQALSPVSSKDKAHTSKSKDVCPSPQNGGSPSNKIFAETFSRSGMSFD